MDKIPNKLKCVMCFKEAEIMLEGTSLCVECYKTTDRYRSNVIKHILGIKEDKK